MNKTQRATRGQDYDPTPVFCHSVADDAGMNPPARAVYMHLSRRAGRDGRCFPSQQSIGDICFPSIPKAESRRKAAMRAIKELVERGFIEKRSRGRGPYGSQSIDYRIISTAQVLAANPPKHGLKLLSAKPDIVTPGGVLSDDTKVLPSLTAKTAVPGRDRDFAIAQAEPDRTRNEAPRSRSTQGDKWVAGTATYPDKLLSQPVLNSDKSNYVQPTYRSFEFENFFSPEEGLVPLWGGEDNLEFVPNASIVDRTNASTIEPNHIPDTSKMVEVIAQPEQPTEEKQPRPELQDRIRKQKRVPPPRPRKMSRAAQNYAYRYDAAGWLQLPPANGINSQARAIAVRALQELILQDYGGRGLAAEWEEDGDGFWRVLDHKSCGEELTMEEALSKRGRLPLQELRNYAATFAGLDQETFNAGLQRLYETALEYCQEYGRLDMLEDGERWIDQPIFDDYLGAYLQSA
jgi:hypothetical protein